MSILISTNGRLVKSGDAVEHYRQKQKLTIGKPVENLDDKLKENKEFKPKKYLNIRGLEFAIETPKGYVRKGVDDDGEEWRTKMFYDYGFIVGTLGVDQDEVDAYLGPDKESDKVFIIHQKHPESGKFDEDKCMVFFTDWNHARDAYLAHYDDQNFLGDHTEMDFDTFKEKVFKTRNKPGMIKSLVIKLKKSLEGNELNEFNNKHPRDDKGQFANKDGAYVKDLFENYKKKYAKSYGTPLGEIKLTEKDFHKIVGIENFGRKAFGRMLEEGSIDWSEIRTSSMRDLRVFDYIEEILTDPDEIRISKNNKLQADFIFVLDMEGEEYYVAFTKEELVRTLHNFDKDYIDRHSGEVIYTKQKGLVKSLTSPSKFVTPFALRMASDFPKAIICSAGIKVKRIGVKLLWKSQMNLFGGESKPQMNLFQKHVGDTKEGKHGTLIIKKNPSGHGAHVEYVAKNEELKTKSDGRETEDKNKLELTPEDLDSIKAFAFIKDFADQFEVAQFRKDTMRGKSEIEPSKIKFEKFKDSYAYELAERLRSTFTKHKNQFGDVLIFDNYMLRLKNNNANEMNADTKQKMNIDQEKKENKQSVLDVRTANEETDLPSGETVKNPVPKEPDLANDNPFGTGKNAKVKIDSKLFVEGMMHPDWSWAILNDVPLPDGYKLVNSKFVQRKINDYNPLWRISIIENKNGERYSYAENAKEQFGSSVGAIAQFEKIKDDDINDFPKLYSTIGKIIAKFWDENTKEIEQQGGLFEGRSDATAEKKESRQQEQEKIKWEYLNQDMPQEEHTKFKSHEGIDYKFYKDTNGYRDVSGRIYAVKNNKVVGTLLFGDTEYGELTGSVEVHPDYRRQGIATQMYNFGEEIEGKKFIEPSSNSEDAKAFWRNRKFNQNKKSGQEHEDKVKARLDEKQKDKQFKDVNERVPMSKKEMAAFRVLTLAELSKLDEASAFTVVTKDRLIPELDITKLKDDGELSGLIWFKKKLRDLVSQKPANSDIARKVYVEKLPQYFEEINNAKNIDDIINSFRDKIIAKRKSWRSESKTFRFEKEADLKDLPLEDVFGKAFCNFVTMNNDTAREQVMNAKLMNEFTEEEARKSYDDSIKRGEEFRSKRIEAEQKYTDEKWGEELVSESMYPFMEKMGLGSKEVHKAKREDPAKFAEMVEKYKQYRKKRIENAQPSYSSYEDFVGKSAKNKPRENNWDWMNGEKKERKVSKDLKIHDNPPLSFIKRENGREVKESEINPETITNEFGFKSVQLGHYVKDNEAKEHIRHFIASLKDMEDALEIDLKKLQAEGGLSIAFGARGGGKALAHYEPSFKIINITKTKGDGSVAHEWLHYFDHFIGGGGIDTNNRTFATHKPADPNDEISIAVKKVVEEMNKGVGTVKKTFEPRKDKSYINGLESIYKSEGLEGAIKYIEKRMNPQFQDHSFEILARIHGKPIEIELPKKTSDFMSGALSFKSDYWKKPLEMFARAGEAYIQDKLAEKQMYNNYLVSGNDSSAEDAKWAAEWLNKTYPQGEERKRINAAFDNLFDVVRKKGFAKRFDENEKRVGEYVDIQKSLDLEILDFGNTVVELIDEQFVW